jgi:hypothetical protein
MTATTRQIVGANSQILTIAVLPNAAGTTGDSQLVGLTDANANAITPAQDGTLTSGALKAQVTAQPRGSKVLTTPTVGTSPASVLAANSSRKLAVLTNPSTNTGIIYIGPSTITTSAYTIALPPGSSYVDDASNDAWYAVSSVSETVAVTETS